MNPEMLVSVKDLHTRFKMPRAHPLKPRKYVHAVDGVSFDIRRGSTFGLVGESGCGKSTTALSILRLVEPIGGKVYFKGTDILQLKTEEMRQKRRNMQIVFQDPYSSMNPRSTAGDIVKAPLDVLTIGTLQERNDRVGELFAKVGLHPEQRSLFPHQFSGGQRQRICVARALASNAEFLVCDEPVSALDVAIQAQILNLLQELQEELGLTYLFISHDVGVVQHICDEIAVMYLGRIVEQADRRSLFQNMLHPYTQALMAAIPKIDLDAEKSTERLRGDVPSPIDPPPGCHFHTRCPHAETQCRQQVPVLREVLPSHRVACHLAESDGLHHRSSTRLVVS